MLAWAGVRKGVPEKDGHAGLRPDIAVRMRVQGLAAAIRCSHAGANKHEGRLPVHGQVDSHGEALRAAAVAQAAGDKVGCDE